MHVASKGSLLPVRIADGIESAGTQDLVRKEGDRLIVALTPENRLLDVLARMESCDEIFPDIDDSPPRARDLV